MKDEILHISPRIEGPILKVDWEAYFKGVQEYHRIQFELKLTFINEPPFAVLSGYSASSDNAFTGDEQKALQKIFEGLYHKIANHHEIFRAHDPKVLIAMFTEEFRMPEWVVEEILDFVFENIKTDLMKFIPEYDYYECDVAWDGDCDGNERVFECFVCGNNTCLSCSEKRDYLRYGMVRICRNCTEDLDR